MKVETVIDLADMVWETASGDPEGKYLSLSGNAAPMSSAFDPWKIIDQDFGNSSEWNVGSMSHKATLPSRRIPLARLVHTAGSTGELDDPDSAVRRFGFYGGAPSSKDPFPSFGPYWFLRDPYLYDQYTAECMVSLALSCPKGNGPDELTFCGGHRSLSFFKIALESCMIRSNAGLALYGQDQVF